MALKPAADERPEPEPAEEQYGLDKVIFLAGSAFVAVATLLGAVADIQSLFSSRTAALRQALVIVGLLAVFAMAYAVLRHFLTRPRLRKLQPFLVLGFFLAVAVIAVNWWKEDRRGTPITVYNKVTEGITMKDTGPGFLSSQPHLSEVWVVRDQRGGLSLPLC